MRTMVNRPQPSAAHTHYHPPHLQEVASLLGAALVRLRRHTAEGLARDAGWVGAEAESSLHFAAHQSVHANSTPRREA